MQKDNAMESHEQVCLIRYDTIIKRIDGLENRQWIAVGFMVAAQATLLTTILVAFLT